MYDDKKSCEEKVLENYKTHFDAGVPDGRYSDLWLGQIFLRVNLGCRIEHGLRRALVLWLSDGSVEITVCVERDNAIRIEQRSTAAVNYCCGSRLVCNNPRNHGGGGGKGREAKKKKKEK